jgi:hypothetical protein
LNPKFWLRPSRAPRKCGVEPAAGEPSLALSGLALAQATKPFTSVTLAGTWGPTAKPWWITDEVLTGVKSANGS